MHVRGIAKKLLYGSGPFYRGMFPYFGCEVFFPKGSNVFGWACTEGTYERDVLALILSVVEPGTCYIDVGANIGLLSLPILVRQPTATVISIEGSCEVLPFLERTRSHSPFRDRWRVVGCAVGSSAGSATFWTSKAAEGAFDGLRDTGRGGAKRAETVEVKKLDDVWEVAGRPCVSAIKLDVEGGELDVIEGARKLIDHHRPALIIEWNALNLLSYGLEPQRLLATCREIGYRAYAHPGLTPVDNDTVLKAAMAQTETFLLASIGQQPKE